MFVVKMLPWIFAAALGVSFLEWNFSASLPQNEVNEKKDKHQSPKDDSAMVVVQYDGFIGFLDWSWEKIRRNSDPILAIGTLAIAFFTLKLFADARNKGQKELRAYVGVEDMYFVYKGGEQTFAIDREFTDVFKIRIKNYGKTPARKVVVYFDRNNDAKTSSLPNLISWHMLEPDQRWSREWPKTAGFLQSTPLFYVVGRIIYQDIYKRWWDNQFCFSYVRTEDDPRGVFAPYGEYNGEKGPCKKRPA